MPFKHSLDKYLLITHLLCGGCGTSHHAWEGRRVQEGFMEEIVSKLSLEEWIKEPREGIHTD